MKQLSLLSALCAFFFATLIHAQDSGSGADGGGSDGGAYSGAYGGGSGVGIVVGENYVLKPSDVVSVEVEQ